MRLPLDLAPRIFVLLPLLVLAGCGGGESGEAGTDAGEQPTTATNSPTAARQSPAPASPRSPRAAGSPSPASRPARPGPPASTFHPKPHQDSGSGSEQFVVKGADNSVQEFGTEAGATAFDQAATTLHDFLDARAERNWAAACSYLSAEVKQSFTQLASPGRGQECPAALAALSGRVPTATLREAAVADIGSLRREGEGGFLIYRGAPKGTIYAISVTREAGSWRVASLAGTPLN